MICERCGATGVDYQVTERTAAGFVEFRYCESCCRSEADLPDPPPEGLYTMIDRANGTSRVVTLTEMVEQFGRSGRA